MKFSQLILKVMKMGDVLIINGPSSVAAGLWWRLPGCYVWMWGHFAETAALSLEPACIAAEWGEWNKRWHLCLKPGPDSTQFYSFKMCCPRSQVNIYSVYCPLGLVSVSSPEPSGFLSNSNTYSLSVSWRHKPNYEDRLCWGTWQLLG